jgi:hypothetical protein
VFGLAPNWLNAGPTGLLKYGLPDGFRDRTETQTFGALVVHHAGRFDQICFKLYATVDSGPNSKHARDLHQLRPSREDLLDGARWTLTHDPSEGFRGQLEQVLAWMGVDDADV